MTNGSAVNDNMAQFDEHDDSNIDSILDAFENDDSDNDDSNDNINARHDVNPETTRDKTSELPNKTIHLFEVAFVVLMIGVCAFTILRMPSFITEVSEQTANVLSTENVIGNENVNGDIANSNTYGYIESSVHDSLPEQKKWVTDIIDSDDITDDDIITAHALGKENDGWNCIVSSLKKGDWGSYNDIGISDSDDMHLEEITGDDNIVKMYVRYCEACMKYLEDKHDIKVTPIRFDISGTSVINPYKSGVYRTDGTCWFGVFEDKSTGEEIACSYHRWANVPYFMDDYNDADDTDDAKTGHDDDSTSNINDTVFYNGLVPGKEYRLSTYRNDDDSRTMVGTIDFIPQYSSGTASIDIPISTFKNGDKVTLLETIQVKN